MALRDITDVKQNLRAYGGLSCLKIGVTIEGENYLVKFPGNLKARELKNVNLSYSNGALCEYVCSHIFEIFGMPVHETELAIRGNKLVVMCKDFITKGVRLAEFRELKATYEPAFINQYGDKTDGSGSDIDEALLVMRSHPTFLRVPGVENFFWKMFIIDAFIGNPDRNNGNWGVLIINDEHVQLAPVYDNGNGLNDKWDDEKMNRFLQNEELILNEAYRGKVCFFTKDGHRVNPFKLIESYEYSECTNALRELLRNDVMDDVLTFLKSVSNLTSTQLEFYTKLLTLRYDKLKSISKQCSAARIRSQK